MLKQVQHDIFQHVTIATQSPRYRNALEEQGDEIGDVAKPDGQVYERFQQFSRVAWSDWNTVDVSCQFY
jgi:hypothetical protein